MSTMSRKRHRAFEQHPYIVVGVDGSHASELALRWALQEAKRSGAAVEAVRVWTDPWAVTGPPSLRGAGREGIGKLHEELATAVREAKEAEQVDSVVVVEEVLPGSPADVLVGESEEAELLVVGTRGLNRVGRWLLGSVSRECSVLSRVPVVLVPDPFAHPADWKPLRARSGASHEPVAVGAISGAAPSGTRGLPGSLTAR